MGRGGQQALFSEEVNCVVHGIISMGSGPGEPEFPRVGTYCVQESLEKGLVRGVNGCRVCHDYTEGTDGEAQITVDGGREEGEAVPTVPLHGEKAAADQP